MKYPTDHKSKTRERLLQEASKAFRADGPERMSIAAVMKGAGMTVGGFYAHFASKDDLIAEAVNYMFEERYAAFFAHIDTPNPREALTRFVEFYVSMRHRDAKVGGCPIPPLGGQVPNLPPTAQERFQAAVDRLADGVTELLQAMDVPDASQRAGAALAEMIGAISLARLTRDDIRAKTLLETALRSVKTRLCLIPA